MSALLKLDEGIYAVKHEVFEKGRDYLRALVNQYPGTINFSIGAGRIYRGLDTHLPSIPGLEDEREWLCRHLTAYAYQFAANELAQAVDVTLTISRNRAELAPPMVVEEGELFVAIDTKGAWHSVFLPPYHALSDAREIAIACGLNVECRVINPGYHGLKEDKGTGPFNATSNLPDRDPLNRFKDSLRDTEEKWPPPSFLTPAIEHGDEPHEPPEVGPKLPPEVVAAVSPFVSNHPSHPEPKDEESEDFEESMGPEQEPTESVSAILSHAGDQYPLAHSTPEQHPVTEVAARRQPTEASAKPAARIASASSATREKSPVAARQASAVPARAPQARVAAPTPAAVKSAVAVMHQSIAAAAPEPALTQTTKAAERGERTRPQETPNAAPAHRTEPSPEAAHIEPTHTPETREAPHAEPEHTAEPKRTEQPEQTAEARQEPAESPRAEPERKAEPQPAEQSRQTAEAEHEPAESPHAESVRHTEERTSEPVHATEAETAPAAHTHAAQAPHATPPHQAAASLSEPQTDLERREIKFAEKEELSPHVTQASFAPVQAHNAALQTSHTPAYVHLLDVPTHHHVYDAIQPQNKVAVLTAAAQPQVKVATAPSASPSLAPKIVPPPVPVAKSTPSPRRLTRAAFLKRLVVPGLMPMPGEEGSEEL